MLLNRIELFLTVAKHKSLGKTTGEMHVSGSSVCQRLKLLENDFGVKLYKKYKGGIELTGAGRTLLATGTDVNIQMSPKYEKLVMRIIDTGGGFPFPDD